MKKLWLRLYILKECVCHLYMSKNANKGESKVCFISGEKDRQNKKQITCVEQEKGGRHCFDAFGTKYRKTRRPRKDKNRILWPVQLFW